MRLEVKSALAPSPILAVVHASDFSAVHGSLDV
jgi:hypothetical protein